METSVVTVKGQIVIPARIRRKFGLKKGTKVAVVEQEDRFTVEPMDKRYFEQFAGLLPIKGKATNALLGERTKDRERENRRSG